MAEDTKKKITFGVTNTTFTVTRKKFSEANAASNKLFITQLEDVEVNWSEVKDGDTSTSPFRGLKMPRLTFRFASNHNDDRKCYVDKTLFPIDFNASTIPGGDKEGMIENIFSWIKYIIDIYRNKKPYTDKESQALTFSFEVEDVADLILIDKQDLLNEYGKIFNNAAAILNGSFELTEGQTPKPIYKTIDGKAIPVWTKLIRCIKTKQGWFNVNPNGDLGFPTFLGEGVLEKVHGNNPPEIIRFDVVKESITPQENKKPTIGGFQQMPGAISTTPNMMGTPMVGSESAAFSAAGLEPPF